MHPLTFKPLSRTLIRLATLVSALSSASIVVAQNAEPGGGMQDERRSVQGQGQLNQDSRPREPAQPGLSKQDSSMMRSMAKANIAEIQLSALAQAISENQIVRAYAQRMLDDHSKALEDLKKMAAANGVVMPGGPDEEHVVAAKQLALMKGDDFNRKYLAHAGMEAHEKSRQLYQNVGERAEDNVLKTYAAKTVLTIDQHLKLAQQAQQNYAAPRTQQKSAAP